MGRVEEAAGAIARLLFGADPGERVPTVVELSSQLSVGSGTVQAAFDLLREKGALAVRSRGHLGSFLTDRNLAALWAACGHGPVRLVMPLPLSMEFVGLATALTQSFGSVAVALQLAFRQGGSQRLAALYTKSADVVVLSSLAVPRLDRSRVSWAVLPDYTFYGRAAVVVLTAGDAPPRQGCRVAIDRHSFDHVAMTRAEFPDARFVGADYVRIPELVASGQVDAAVWHQTGVVPLLAATRVVVHPASPTNPASHPSSSRACLVHRRDDTAVAQLLAAVIDGQQVAAIQRAVLGGETAPSF